MIRFCVPPLAAICCLSVDLRTSSLSLIPQPTLSFAEPISKLESDSVYLHLPLITSTAIKPNQALRLRYSNQLHISFVISSAEWNISLSTFPLFWGLPKELQVYIWELAFAFGANSPFGKAFLYQVGLGLVQKYHYRLPFLHQKSRLGGQALNMLQIMEDFDRDLLSVSTAHA